MPTGDIRNNLRKLQSELKAVRYESDIDPKALACGQIEGLLHIYHHVFVDYSRPLAELISNMNIELGGKQDDRFMEAIYRILRDMFSYKPPVTKEQFFSPGFGEQKIIMCTDVIQLAKQRHKELAPRVSSASTRVSSTHRHSASKLAAMSAVEMSSQPPVVQVVKEMPRVNPPAPSTTTLPGARTTQTSSATALPGNRNALMPKIVHHKIPTSSSTASPSASSPGEGVPPALVSILANIQQYQYHPYPGALCDADFRETGVEDGEVGGSGRTGGNVHLITPGGFKEVFERS